MGFDLKKVDLGYHWFEAFAFPETVKVPNLQAVIGFFCEGSLYFHSADRNIGSPVFTHPVPNN